MSNKMSKVIFMAVAMVAAFAVAAFADPVTDAERAEQQALNGKHYTEVTYTSGQYAQARETEAVAGTKQSMVGVNEEHAYTDVAYDAEDYAAAEELMAMEERDSATPFAEVQHVASAGVQQNG